MGTKAGSQSDDDITALLTLLMAAQARPLLHARTRPGLITSAPLTDCGTPQQVGQDLYRSDGVRITHDPHAQGMAEKYGAQGRTDPEGFDPYADTVGAGIYGGRVKRDSAGNVIIGEQYQGHNSRPGPVYAGGGYTPMTQALRVGTAAIDELLEQDPSLVSEISTGGATPLHMCGMSRGAESMTAHIIARGGQVDALDSYGFTPLDRMASNNLAIGALALLEAGARLDASASGFTPMQIAQQSRARDVLRVLKEWQAREQSQ